MTTLRERAVFGAKWTTFSAVVSTSLQIAQLLVLARLLAREDFGLMSMLTVVVGLLATLCDLGVSNAIIYRQQASAEELSSLFWLNLLAGGLICTLLLLAAPLVAHAFSEPRLTPLIRLAAVAFLIVPLGQQFEILLLRDLKFRPLAFIEIASTAGGVAVALFVAALGGGAAAFVWGTLANNAVKASSLMVVGMRRHRPQLRFRLGDVHSYVSFGLYQIGERAVNYLSARVDVILIGRYLGADSLGLYSLAYQLVLMPLTRINPILTRVAFPVFAKRQRDDSLTKGFLELTKVLAIMVFPFSIGLAMTVPVAVPVLFGEKWDAVVGLTQALAIVGLMKTMANPTGSILLTKGRPDIGFWFNVLVLFSNAAAFSLMVGQGLYPLIWTYQVLSAAYLLCLLFLLRRMLGFAWGRYLAALKPAIAASTGMVLALVLAYNAPMESISRLSRLFVLVLSGGGAYLLSLYLLERKYLRSLLALFREREE